MAVRFTLALAGSLLIASPICAAEVKLLGSAAVKAAYVELIPQFEKSTGHKVSAAWSSSPDIQKRISGGEAADVVILSNSGADALIKDGKLVSASRVDLAQSGISVAVKAGAPKPDIHSADAVKKTILDAKAVAHSAGASGSYIVRMFDKLGVSEQAKAKTATVKQGEPVGEV